MIPGLHETEDGNELHFQVNHLSHFLLANLLEETLRQSAPARIVIVSSTGWMFGGFFDLGRYAPDALNLLPSSYDEISTYLNTKLMNILHSHELNRRLSGSNLTSVAVCPGIVATGFARHASGQWYAPRWLINSFNYAIARGIDDGAARIVEAATHPDLQSDGMLLNSYFHGTPGPDFFFDVEEASEWLWTTSMQIIADSPLRTGRKRADT
jgi:NAD(P)-dependent dehydrogenase (short-subunit alcohol dehydrogenase family)